MSYMAEFKQNLRDQIVELGALQGTQLEKFEAMKKTLFTAGGMFLTGLVFVPFGVAAGPYAMAAGDTLGQLLLTGVSLWAGLTAYKGMQAAAQFVSLMVDDGETVLPTRPRPVAREMGRCWLPLAAGAAVAVTTSFALLAQLPRDANAVSPSIKSKAQSPQP